MNASGGERAQRLTRHESGHAGKKPTLALIYETATLGGSFEAVIV